MHCNYFRLLNHISQGLLLNTQAPNNLFVNILKRWAGHSKWQNIKSTKEGMERKKSVAFNNLRSKIVSAIKKGGENPDHNSELRNVLEEARKANMPSTSIQRIIKQANQTQKPYWIYYSGWNNLIIGIEVNSNNVNSIKDILGSQLKKLNVKFEKNPQNYLVERGILIANPMKGVANVYDKALEDAIEAGMDEVTEDESKNLVFECLPSHVDNAHKKLSEKGYSIISSTVEVQFNDYTNVGEDIYKQINAIYEKIQNSHDDVLRIVDNVNT